MSLAPVGWAVTAEERAWIHSSLGVDGFEGLLGWRYADGDWEEKYRIFKTNLKGNLEE